MKKLITVILLFMFCICISGCSNNNQKTTWNMRSIQDNNGEVIYCSNESKDVYLNAIVKDVVCILQGSSVTITDKSSSNKWIGTCTKMDSSKDIYEVIFDNNKKGTLSKSVTKYEDNTKENTLVISCEGYTLYFNENTDEKN
ncbi:hypothetical protein [Paraclostridium bifermentans]|uniref:hypothetical protein n=1 Tax=Paraclostridium bifermentans TaxID=1490 RepID=UPI0018AC25E6|nr:hypothetical protein [Paraclostridium bifermentans]